MTSFGLALAVARHRLLDNAELACAELGFWTVDTTGRWRGTATQLKLRRPRSD
jgi:hypothetical protein